MTTNTQTAEITIKATITDQFCRDVLCTAIEGGSNYWASFKVLKRIKGQYCEEYEIVRVMEMDVDGSGGEIARFTVDPQTIREGIARLVNGGMHDGRHSSDAHPDYRADVMRAVMSDDAGQIDANLADLILQASALSCIRYG